MGARLEKSTAYTSETHSTVSVQPAPAREKKISERCRPKEAVIGARAPGGGATEGGKGIGRVRKFVIGMLHISREEDIRARNISHTKKEL